MAANTARYRKDGAVAWGMVAGDRITRIPGDYATTRVFMLEGAPRARQGESEGEPLALADVQVLCPITSERQFICQAVNYHSHMREMGMTTAASPFNIFFRKASSCLAPADTEIVLPGHAHCDQVSARVVSAPVRAVEPRVVLAVLGGQLLMVRGM